MLNTYVKSINIVEWKFRVMAFVYRHLNWRQLGPVLLTINGLASAIMLSWYTDAKMKPSWFANWNHRLRDHTYARLGAHIFPWSEFHADTNAFTFLDGGPSSCMRGIMKLNNSFYSDSNTLLLTVSFFSPSFYAFFTLL